MVFLQHIRKCLICDLLNRLHTVPRKKLERIPSLRVELDQLALLRRCLGAIDVLRLGYLGWPPRPPRSILRHYPLTLPSVAPRFARPSSRRQSRGPPPSCGPACDWPQTQPPQR